MKRIASFEVDHNKLKWGIYISRVDDNIKTLDLRFRESNTPPFLSNAAIHSIEHLFSTIARNSKYFKNHSLFWPYGMQNRVLFFS